VVEEVRERALASSGKRGYVPGLEEGMYLIDERKEQGCKLLLMR
jgi:hypothetical protein